MRVWTRFTECVQSWTTTSGSRARRHEGTSRDWGWLQLVDAAASAYGWPSTSDASRARSSIRSPPQATQAECEARSAVDAGHRRPPRYRGVSRSGTASWGLTAVQSAVRWGDRMILTGPEIARAARRGQIVIKPSRRTIWNRTATVSPSATVCCPSPEDGQVVKSKTARRDTSGGERT